MSDTRRYPIPTRKYPPRRGVPPLVARRDVWHNVGAMLGLAFLATLTLAAVLAPFVTPHNPQVVAPAEQFQPPSREHWAGTDLFGRDVFSRLLYGTRISLEVGVVAVVIAALPGTLLGLLAGYYGGWVDGVISRLMDVLLAFPGILLALSIVALLGTGLRNVTLAVGIAGIPGYTRLARSSVLTIKRKMFVRAAHAIGCRDSRILFHHILPNVLAPIIVLATLDIAWAILNASALNFLGLGVELGTPEWGVMLNEGRGYLRDAPWVSVAPGLTLTLTVLAVNLLGDGLRDALDPRLRP
ncbi:MAG: ABC transporter permease [Chloroflexota bacterium]|nr:ABC transporter permease [Chloroflexota bacterium]